MDSGAETLPPATAGARLGRVAGNAARVVLGLILLAMVLLNVLNAIGRYFIGAVLVGADELLVFAMIWLVMIGLILVTSEDRNIALDFLLNRMGPRARTAIMAANRSNRET